MKRLILLANLIALSLLWSFAQSGAVIDDVYLSPNDAQMIKAAKPEKIKIDNQNQSTIIRNGAREIVFIDKDGNRTTAISDTVYIIDGEVYADTLYVEEPDYEEGYYLNGFTGSESDFEYAERIRRFHNPRYTITIADPGYSDIYFLDDNYWNVYIDGMYATITPTWTNPYWWNYNYSPYSYNSWAWRHNWGYPSWSSFGWGGYYGLGYSHYGGWYDPWYSGYYGWGNHLGFGWGGYYGWGSPYYGGHYGWGYPYYNGYWGYGSAYQTSNQSFRKNYTASRVAPFDGSGSTRTTAVNASRVNTRSGTIMATRQLAGERSAVATRSGVDTRMRTGAVRTTDEWSAVRGSRQSSGENTIVNRTSSASRGSSSIGSSSTNRSTVGTRSSSVGGGSRINTGASRSTYNTGTSRSTPNYSTGSSTRSSSSMSSGASRSSSSFMSSGSSSRSSVSGGGRR